MSIIDTFPKKNKANLLVTEINQEVYNQLSNEELTNGTMYLINDGVLESERVAACGYTPIGTIISVMGNTPPLFYLACNGQEFNIIDYPDLANYFAEQFGSVNNFGGDGIDTFAVPDLRESTLVGSGQNTVRTIKTHDIFNVGEFKDDAFQDHSHIAYASVHDTNSSASQGYPLNNNHYTFRTSDRGGTYTISQLLGARTLNNVEPRKDSVTRTKETGVLYCIAYRNICIDAKNNYSTDEQLIGYWIDNKPLYQKVVTNIVLPNSANKTDYYLSDIGLNNIDHIFIENSYVVLNNNNMTPMPWINSNSGNNICAITDINSEYLQLKTDSDRSDCKLTIIFRYTKTTV